MKNALFKAQREECFEHFMSEKIMMDHFAAILSRGGLAFKKSCINEFSIYHIEHANEFDGRLLPTIEYRGYIHFQNDISIGRNIHERIQVDLNDPNYHIKLLKFFGVEDYLFQIFADHQVFEDYN